MTVTLYRCAECGHRMSLTGDACDHCHAHKPDLFRAHVLVIFTIGAVLSVGLAAL